MMDSDLPVSSRRLDTSLSSAVEDLVSSANDWRNIQDIIRVTFKALADTVKRQDAQLRDLRDLQQRQEEQIQVLQQEEDSQFQALEQHQKEQFEVWRKQVETQIQTLQQRQEDVYTALAAGMESKVSEPELVSALTDLERRLNLKSVFASLETAVSEKPSLSDIQTLLRPKANMDEVSRLLDLKATKWDSDAALLDLERHFNDALEDLSEKLSSAAAKTDLEALEEAYDTCKASLTQLETDLSKKANSDSVASFLRKKASREDVESALAKKADLSTVKDLVSALESKADQRWVEQLSEIVDLKADRQEIAERIIPEIALKTNRTDFDDLQTRLKEVKANCDKKCADLARTLEVKVAALTKDLDPISSQFERLQTQQDQLKSTIEKFGNKKADVRDMDNLAGLLSKKADLDYMAQVVASSRDEVLERVDGVFATLKSPKIDSFEDVFRQLDVLRTEQKAILSDFRQFSDGQIQAEIERKKDTESVEMYVRTLNDNLAQDMKGEIERLKEDLSVVLEEVDSLAKAKADKVDLQDLDQKSAACFSSKADLNFVDQEIEKCQKALLTSLQLLKEDIRTKLNSIESGLQKQVETKVSATDFKAAVAQSVDSARLLKAIAGKVEKAEVDSLVQMMSELRSDLGKKAAQADLELQVTVLRSALNDASRDISEKANISDFCSLLDSKASEFYSDIDDINSALEALHLADKENVTSQEFKECMRTQTDLLESLISQSLEGRWGWTGGEIKPNGLIPWETQYINTAPDMFLWERNSASVLTASAGVYEVSFAFFSRKKPTVQVLVNNEVVLAAVNSAGYVVHNVRKGAPISGLSLIDFLTLPARARVSLSYAGETLGSGFFALRKV